MIDVQPITIEKETFVAITVKLPKTNFMAVTCDTGYIMCGALDVKLLNEKLKERGIIAGRAVGVRTIEQLLEAPLESVTLKCEELGIHKGMTGKDALIKNETIDVNELKTGVDVFMEQYLQLCEHVLQNGSPKSDRTGTGTISVFGYQMRFDLEKGFPIVTTKKLHMRSIIHELLWFLKGDTNIRYLQENGVRIWNEWADENGDLGPVYGKQWRSWEGANGKTVDQITEVVEQIKTNPNSRRLIVNAWNVAEIEEMALAPCHCLFQFYVNDGKLSCQLYQRSADIFLGVPFNISSYALLTMMMAQVCGLKPGEFIHTFGDAHLYNNHIEQTKLQLTRKPKQLPTMHINPEVTDLFAFTYDDFELKHYDPYPHIKAEVSV